jgi:putative membrane protein
VERVAQLLLSWAVNALVLAGVAWILNGVWFHDRTDLIVAAAVFGILNTILKPLAKVLTLPLAVLTLGIAWFFVAMLMLWITVSLVGGFHVNGFWNYVWATIIIWVLNLVLDEALKPWRRSRGQEYRLQG